MRCSNTITHSLILKVRQTCTRTFMLTHKRAFALPQASIFTDSDSNTLSRQQQKKKEIKKEMCEFLYCTYFPNPNNNNSISVYFRLLRTVFFTKFYQFEWFLCPSSTRMLCAFLTAKRKAIKMHRTKEKDGLPKIAPVYHSDCTRICIMYALVCWQWKIWQMYTFFHNSFIFGFSFALLGAVYSYS